MPTPPSRTKFNKYQSDLICPLWHFVLNPCVKCLKIIVAYLLFLLFQKVQ